MPGLGFATRAARSVWLVAVLFAPLSALRAADAPTPPHDAAAADVAAAQAADQARRQDQTLRRANELQASGGTGDAVAVLQAHVERWPNDDLVRQALLQAQIAELESEIRKNLGEQARTKDLIIGDPDYEAARERAAEEVQKRLATVEYFVSQHRYPQAVDACDAILKDHPGHPAVLTIKLHILRLLEKTVMDERTGLLREKEVNREARLNQVIDQATMPNDKETEARTVLVFAEDVAESERQRIRQKLQDRIDLIQDNVEVRKVIETLFSVAGINYVLLDSAIGADTMTIHLVNETVDTVLQTIGKQVNLQFNYHGGVVYVASGASTVLETEIIRVDSGLTNVMAKPTLSQLAQSQPTGGTGFGANGQLQQLAQQNGFNLGLDQQQNQQNQNDPNGGKSDLEKFLDEIKAGRIIVGWPADGDIYLDKKSNTVYVRSTPACIAELKRLLHAMDYNSVQVLIEARFVEVTDEANRKLGTNLLAQTSIKNVDIGGANNASGLQLPPANPPAAPAAGFAAVFSGSGFAHFPDFRAAITALETTNEANTLSEPKILTLNNQQGLISLTHDVSYIAQWQPQTSTNSTPNGIGTVVSNTTTTYQPEVQVTQEGIELKITPSVARNSDIITLDISPTVKQLVQLRQIPFTYVPGSGSSPVSLNTEKPEFDTRSLHTALHVQNGQTIVLGGLIKENDQKSTTGTPFLSRIPVLGYLFGSKTKSHDRRHLLIFVTARITNPDGANVDDRMRVLRDTARVVVPDNAPEQSRQYGAAPNRDEPARVDAAGGTSGTAWQSKGRGR